MGQIQVKDAAIEPAAELVTVIANDQQQAVGLEVLARLRDGVKQIEAQRVALKEPHLEAGRAVDKEAAAFKNRFEVHIQRILPMLTRYDTQKRIAAEKERLEAERVAKEQAAELKRLAEEQAAELAKEAGQAKEVAELALAGAGTEEEQLEALQASEDADRNAMAAQMQAGNIEAMASTLVQSAAANVFTGRSYGAAGATAKSRVEYYHELEDITKVPEQYLVDPVDRIRKSALPRASTTRPAEIPGFVIRERTAIATKV